MGKREHKTNREAERKPEVPGRKARKVEKNNRRSNKNKSTSRNVREVEGRKAKIKGIKKQEQRMWIKKMRVQTAPYIEKQHVTQMGEQQKTTGEKKGKGLISGATSVVQGKSGGYTQYITCAL